MRSRWIDGTRHDAHVPLLDRNWFANFAGTEPLEMGPRRVGDWPAFLFLAPRPAPASPPGYLPGALDRDLVVPMPGVERWADTLSHDAVQGRWHMSIRAIRSFEVVGDTLVEGRPAAIIAERSRVRLEERVPELDIDAAGAPLLVRIGEGERWGRIVADPSGGPPWVRSDTTILAGTVTLQGPEGRSWTVPTRYEELRDDRRHAPDAWADTLDARRTADRRPGRGRAGVIDPEATEPSSAPDRWEWNLARGDTAAAFGDLLSFAGERGSRPIRPADLEVLRPFLVDSGEGLRVGGSTRGLREGLISALTRFPPALSGFEGYAPCDPEACRILAELDRLPGEGSDGAEPGLVDLAVAARALTDPATHAAELRARPAPEGSAMARVRFLAGVHASWGRDGGGPPAPGAGSDWRAWWQWLDPWPMGFLGSPMAPTLLRDRAKALLLLSVVDGRDFAPEWDAMDEAARAGSLPDSVHLVVGVLRAMARAAPPDPGQVEALLSSEIPELRELGKFELGLLFLRPPGEPRVAWGEDPGQLELAEQVLRHAFGDPDGEEEPGRVLHAAPWPALEPERDRPAVEASGTRPGEQRGLSSSGLPSELVERWSASVRRVDRDEGPAVDTRSAESVLYLDPPWIIGNLARVTVSHASRPGGDPGQPAVFRGSITDWFLLNTPEGWVIVTATGLIS